MPTSSTELQQRLVSIAKESSWLMPALFAVRGLGLSSWCIGAGAIRNLVWDSLHEFPTPSALPDIDVAHFDTTDLSAERDADIQRRLSAAFPSLPWEVTNQAAVHLWFENCFGNAVPPLSSLHDAVASWPEYATAVGLTLRQDDTIEVIAPHGLEDLFSLTVRHNPARANIETYRRRIEQKRYSERWPRVQVIHC